MNPPPPLVLGTVQLGMNYGIANRAGQPGMDLAVDIVKTAWESDVRYFDTAQAYGDSERVLGECFKRMSFGNGNEEPAVISKLDPDIDLSRVEEVLNRVDESIERLGQNRLWGLMLHRESSLGYGEKILTQVARRLKSENKIENFGISVYSPEKAIEALHMDEIDIVQLPFNVFDQRAFKGGVFRMARERNRKVFVRSVYLQGFLLLDTNQVPDELAFSRGALRKFISIAKDSQTPPKLLALAFVVQGAHDAMFVIGSENPEQVSENILLLKKAKEVSLPDLSCLSMDDPRLINPSFWFH
ncbi:MAG: aldo/keto reductase [Desulfatiglandales bacterium]|nr:aldo/keto reductase [Desulfatiglandales bacterium]